MAALLDSAPVFDLCDARAKHFLLDLIQQEAPGVLADHPVPELYALLGAIERMWCGGREARNVQLTLRAGSRTKSASD